MSTNSDNMVGLACVTLGAGKHGRTNRSLIVMTAVARGLDENAIDRGLGDVLTYNDPGERFTRGATLIEPLLNPEQHRALEILRGEHGKALEREQRRAADEERRERQRQESLKQAHVRCGTDTPEAYALVGNLTSVVNGAFWTSWTERRDLLIGLFEEALMPRGKRACALAGPMLAVHNLLPGGELRPGRVALVAYNSGVAAGRALAERCIGISSRGSGIIGACDGPETADLVNQLDEALRAATPRRAA